MIRHCDRALTALLALLLLWAPLPFGSATPAALAGLEVAAFLVLALALACRGWSEGLRAVALPALALAALALLGLVQSLPWPHGVVARLSPEHARLFDQAAALVAPEGEAEDLEREARSAAREVRAADGRHAAVPGEPGDLAVASLPGQSHKTAIRVVPSLSLAASTSRWIALAWAAVAAALAAAAVAGRDRRNRRVLGGALLAVGLFEVFHGARAWFGQASTIWGVEVPGGGGRLRGSYVNPDHLALLLGMGLPAAFAWGWWAARRARDEVHMDRRVLLLAPPALAWLTLFAGLAFTGSRAGLVAAVTAAAVQGVLLATVRRRWRLAPVGAVAALAGVGVVAAIGLQEGLGRLLATNPYDVSWAARRTAYAATIELWRRFPVTGTGLGSFLEAFPQVQPEELAGTWRHAHSDPLELLATGGLLGTALLALALAALLVRLAAVLGSGRRSEDRAAGLAALGAVAAVAVHESLDFGLTIPANAFVLAILLGGAAAAPLVGERGGERRNGRWDRRPAGPLAADAKAAPAAAGEDASPEPVRRPPRGGGAKRKKRRPRRGPQPS